MVNTLTGDHERRTTDHTSVVCYPIHDKATRYKGGGPTRKGDGAGNGLGVGKAGDPMPTLTSADRHSVAYAGGVGINGNVAGTLDASYYKGCGLRQGIEREVIIQPPSIVRRLTPTECARLQGFPDAWGHIPERDSLTDEECTFWQDVRDTYAVINGKPKKDYTATQLLTWYNKLHTDSAEYKMWGNGIALPPALYCMQGIVDALDASTGD